MTETIASKFRVEARVNSREQGFVIFCPALGEWLPGLFKHKQDADFACRHYERVLDYYADIEFNHVKLYNLNDAREIWGGKGRIAPVATFVSEAEFHRFTGKSIKQFNNLIVP